MYLSPNVLTCGHQFPQMLRQSWELPSAPGSRSGDNQNFGGGLDGVSCLARGKSILVCAPRRKPDKNNKNARQFSQRVRNGGGLVRNWTHFLLCCPNPTVCLIILLLSGNNSSTGLWSVREARAEYARTYIHTNTHPHSGDSVCGNVTWPTKDRES